MRLSIRLLRILHVTQYLCTKWMDFNENCHKHSPREWALLKQFSRSEVTGRVMATTNALCLADRHPVTYGRPSAVRAAERYQSMEWRQ